MNSGGRRKTISKVYANKGGSRKQIFPYSESTTYTYTWYKYELESTYNPGGPYIDDEYYYRQNPIITDAIYRGDSYYQDQSTGGIFLNVTDSYDASDDGNFPGQSKYLVTAEQRSTTISGVVTDVIWYGWKQDGYVIAHRDHSSDEYYYACEYPGYGSLNAMIGGYKKAGYVYSKGDYIGTVTSNSSSAYPNDGRQDGYWYAYQGKS